MRLLVCCVFAGVVLGQAPAEIHFAPVPSEVVEQRLKAYTVKNNSREPAVRMLFEDAGCGDDKLSEQKVGGTKAPNLICTLSGSSETEIVVGAHFDLIEAGHGVIDNWTGASLLPSLYQGLDTIPRRHTFRFVAFAGEEKGLLGSHAYVKQVLKTHEPVVAMVNMDTLGLAESEVWVSGSDPKLMGMLQGTAQATHLPLTGMNVPDGASTDSASFMAKRIPAITIHSLTPGALTLLHSRNDKIEAVNLERYYRTYRLVLAFAAVLDSQLP